MYIGYKLEDRKIVVRFPERAKDFFFYRASILIAVGNMNIFRGDKRARARS